LDSCSPIDIALASRTFISKKNRETWVALRGGLCLSTGVIISISFDVHMNWASMA